ncbi:MAG TPA: hypothetical protein DCE42_07000 [Myxococcales bacterium]|nr:hypothetical protein [Myxococcales bacterium]
MLLPPPASHRLFLLIPVASKDISPHRDVASYLTHKLQLKHSIQSKRLPLQHRSFGIEQSGHLCGLGRQKKL